MATATFDFTGGYVTVTVKTVAPASWRPVSTACTFTKSASASPTRSPRPAVRPETSCPPAATTRRPGTPAKPESGDLTSLEVRSDGSAYLVTTTDAFTRDELLAGNKTALMLHGAEGTWLACRDGRWSASRAASSAPA